MPMMPALPILAVFAALAAIPPLTGSQQTRLETADDGAATVDEAAFYALLENAQQWPEDVATGAVVPDFQAMRDAPAEHRGQLCLIKGRAQALLPENRWARSGFESVRGLVVRIDAGEDEPTADDIVIIYLLEPPESIAGNQPVELVARFHKIVEYQRVDDDAAPRRYLSFVGREVLTLGRPESGGLSSGLAVVLLILMILGIVFLLWRIRGFTGGQAEQPRKIDRYLAEKRARRSTQEPAGETDETDKIDKTIEASNLPDDPADALDSLHRRHQDRPSE